MYQVKISFKIEGKIKIFPNKWKLRKVVTHIVALLEMLREALLTEEIIPDGNSSLQEKKEKY